jgi:hypothetical protein
MQPTSDDWALAFDDMWDMKLVRKSLEQKKLFGRSEAPEETLARDWKANFLARYYFVDFFGGAFTTLSTLLFTSNHQRIIAADIRT